MTVEKKRVFTAALIVVIVYVATLWQRPMFSPAEFDFAILSMHSTKNFAAVFNGIFGKALKFNIVSVRLMPAVAAIICALCVRYLGRKESGEGFGNISAVIYLSTLLVFSYGTACAREMINTLFMCTAVTAAFSAFEISEDAPKYLRYMPAAAGGGACGLFAASMGIDALFFPFIAISLYAIFSRPKYSKSITVTGFFAAAAVICLWGLNHKIMLFSKYTNFRAEDLLYLIAGTLPWGLFIPQAVYGVLQNKKEFFKKKTVLLSLSVIISGLLVFPVAGIIQTAVMISPFTALLFASALRDSQDNEKAWKISAVTLKIFSLLLLLFTTAVVILSLVPNIPNAWKLYYSKAELAGFAVACTAALIQFKTAIDEKPHNKIKKVIHIATGTAILMILLPGAIPQCIKNIYAPAEFFMATAARYMAPDAAIFADHQSISAVKWVFRNRRVTLINKHTAAAIAKRIKNNKNTAVFSTSRRFTKVLPKSKMLFVRGKWRIVLCQ